MGYGTPPLTNHSKFYGLLHELGDRVRDNQRDHTKRVREQLTLIMASCGPDDPPKPLRDAIEKVFSISGDLRWSGLPRPRGRYRLCWLGGRRQFELLPPA
jgi:hypothetical protein